MLCAETFCFSPIIKQDCQMKAPMLLSLQVRVHRAMHEKHSEDDGSAISVCAVNYDSMIIFSLSSLNYAVCGVLGVALKYWYWLVPQLLIMHLPKKLLLLQQQI